MGLRWQTVSAPVIASLVGWPGSFVRLEILINHDHSGFQHTSNTKHPLRNMRILIQRVQLIVEFVTEVYPAEYQSRSSLVHCFSILCWILYLLFSSAYPVKHHVRRNFRRIVDVSVEDFGYQHGGCCTDDEAD